MASLFTDYVLNYFLVVTIPLVFLSDTYEMVVEEESGMRFTLAHHYESNVKAAGEVSNAARARRLAQEAVTLSTSLPLSYSSSVFVRCDEDRLDVMKVRRKATLWYRPTGMLIL